MAPCAVGLAEPMPSRAELQIESRLYEVVEPWLGTPYRWGRAEKQVGVDCSGFTQHILEKLFVFDLPRSSREQFHVGKAVKRRALVAGDLLFFDTTGAGAIAHVGIYMGGGLFVHASRSRGVVYDELQSFPGRYRGARRLPLRTVKAVAEAMDCGWPRNVCA
jgi:cell wall-associated NlpC family hydrolase